MEEQMIPEEVKKEEQTGTPDKKMMKKDVRCVGWGLILYTVINLLIVSVITAVQLAAFEMQGGSESSVDEYIAVLEQNGTSMIIGVLLSVLVLWLYMRKRVPVNALTKECKKMSPKSFWQIVCVFMASQMVFSLFASVMEVLLNMAGYSAMESVEAASGGSVTFSMFIYVAFIGPVVEELVYRGFVFRALRKHGKMFAIITSSVLFGVMHANLPQMAFAMAIGFVLAYVTEEYSLKWAVVLHIINNFVFAEVMTFVGEHIGGPVGENLTSVVILGFFIAGCVVLKKNRMEIEAYLKENKEVGKKYLWAFTTVPMLIFLVVNLLLGVSMLQPLS